MYNSVSIVCTVLLAFTVAVDSQGFCHLSRNCQDVSPTSADTVSCRNNLQAISYEYINGHCINFPIRFGFVQTIFNGMEQGPDYSVDVGFMEGTHDQQIEVKVDVVLGTAGASDLLLLTPFITFLPRTRELQPVKFSLLLDSVAQEVNETFTLRLSYDENLFGLPTDTVVNELEVTIIDGDSVGFRFSQDLYRADEGIDATALVRIIKDTDKRLANPVTLRITPLTVGEALDQEIIDTFTPEDERTDIKNLRSPLRANGEDFNSAAFTIVFPADEDAPSLTRVLNAPIPIVDDDINEADEQYFIAKLESFDGVNMESIIIKQDFVMVVIGDNDDIRIGFPLDVYEYFEPIVSLSSETVITNLTLVKENNRVSEQIFRVGIVVSDPTSVRPATLETEHSDIYDYRVSSVGQTFILRDFFPLQQTLVVAFILNADDIPEGTEGFTLTSEVEVYDGFSVFLPPLPTSITAFRSTTIQIIDDDVIRVGWEQQNYTFQESMFLAQVCLVVFSPNPSQPLVTDIVLEYETAIGSAATDDHAYVSITSYLG